jgi:hypothetical protein
MQSIITLVTSISEVSRKLMQFYGFFMEIGNWDGFSALDSEVPIKAIPPDPRFASCRKFPTFRII